MGESLKTTFSRGTLDDGARMQLSSRELRKVNKSLMAPVKSFSACGYLFFSLWMFGDDHTLNTFHWRLQRLYFSWFS